MEEEDVHAHKIRQPKSNQVHVHRDRPQSGSRNPQNEAEIRSRRSRPKSAPLWHDFSKHDSFAALSRQFYADRSADRYTTTWIEDAGPINLPTCRVATMQAGHACRERPSS